MSGDRSGAVRECEGGSLAGGASPGVMGGEKASEKSQGERGSPEDTLDNLLSVRNNKETL